MACRCFGLLKSKRDSLVALDLIPLNMLSCLSWPPCSLMVSCIEAEIWGFGDFLPCLNKWFSPQTWGCGVVVGCPKWDAQLAGQKVFKLVKWPNEFHDDPMILANALRVSLQAGPYLLRSGVWMSCCWEDLFKAYRTFKSVLLFRKQTGLLLGGLSRYLT